MGLWSRASFLEFNVVNGAFLWRRGANKKPSSLPVVLCNAALPPCLWFGRWFLVVIVVAYVCVCVCLCLVLTDRLVLCKLIVSWHRPCPQLSLDFSHCWFCSWFEKHVLVSCPFYLKCALLGTKKRHRMFSFCLFR